MQETKIKTDIIRKETGRKPFRLFLVALVAAVAAGGIIFGSLRIIQFFRDSSSGYSAVFLDNDQVYFGKVKYPKRTYVTVADVYYFGQTDSGQVDDVVLVKLGSELHGPANEMKILRNHILFIEELMDDSRVVEAIREYKNNK